MNPVHSLETVGQLLRTLDVAQAHERIVELHVLHAVTVKLPTERTVSDRSETRENVRHGSTTDSTHTRPSVIQVALGDLPRQIFLLRRVTQVLVGAAFSCAQIQSVPLEPLRLVEQERLERLSPDLPALEKRGMAAPLMMGR